MWDFYEKSSPIDVKGGIKAQTKRGEFSSSWWGKRWIEALESFNDSGRLSRGRSYARKGQILSIDINEGNISAKVQGSRPTPYKVVIELEKLTPTAWNHVIEALSTKAIYTARLLAGELPAEVEEIFREVNIQLLPSNHAHLKTDCSCPDWSNPCKHVAAVLYLLGEEFDRDPFLLFKARGMEKEEFLKRLEKSVSRSKQTKKAKQENSQQNIQGNSQPLDHDLDNFWNMKNLPEEWLRSAFDQSTQNGVLVKSLGKFPFWRGENNLQDSMGGLYQQVTNRALELYNNTHERQ